MSFSDWIRRNWADTSAESDPGLRPLSFPSPLPQTFDLVEQSLRSLPRWGVVATDRAAGTLHATRRSRIFGWVDDVHLRLAEIGGTTTLHARSQSRVGKGDFGQNRRNILELFRTLRPHTQTS